MHVYLRWQIILSTVGWRFNLVNTNQPVLRSEGFLEVFQVEGLVADLSVTDTIVTAWTTCKIQLNEYLVADVTIM